MKTIEYSVIIERPIEDVFAFIENLEKRPVWETGVVEVKVLEGEYSKRGSIIEITSKVLGKKMKTVAEVLDYKENEAVICKATKPFPHEVANIYEPVDNGTKFTRRATADMDEVKNFVKVGSSLIFKKIEKSFTETADNAKRILEKQR
ncbi:MAG: SRPBCC family protein [Bacillus sp. (in: Bacteria)]|nr:SRPBCC family protein [Bacillus sp. (in: firmicutes)]